MNRKLLGKVKAKVKRPKNPDHMARSGRGGSLLCAPCRRGKRGKKVCSALNRQFVNARASGLVCRSTPWTLSALASRVKKMGFYVLDDGSPRVLRKLESMKKQCFSLSKLGGLIPPSLKPKSLTVKAFRRDVADCEVGEEVVVPELSEGVAQVEDISSFWDSRDPSEL
jgi:hypothetical protein